MPGESTKYYIIEHPTRGVLKDEPNPETGKPSFSWANSRTDERNARYTTLRRAIQDLTEIDLPAGCAIRCSQHEVDTYNAAWPIVWPPEKAVA